MVKGIRQKITFLTKDNRFQHLLIENQDTHKIKQYYQINKLAYLLFHNKDGYLHMGLSENNKYHKKDLLKQLEIINKNIKQIQAKSVLELGYGRGANLNYLAKENQNVKFYGVDLSTKPLKKYTKEKNIKYINQDYHQLETLHKKFDLVYAIETLCYSNNLPLLFKEISSALNKGGLLITFDAYYRIPKQKLKRYEQLACTLVEKGMAVNKFHELQEFESAAKEANLELIEKENLSKKIIPTLYRFEKIANLYLKNPLLNKIMNATLPEMFLRNGLAGFLMPDLVENNIAVYYLHVFQKT